MRPTIISNAGALWLLSALPNLVMGDFEMAFDNYVYGEGRAPTYRAYDDRTCNRVPPVGVPDILVSIALRSSTQGIQTGYNTRPPPAIAFYRHLNPTGPSPHCVDDALVMVARFYDVPNTVQFFRSPLSRITHFKVIDDEQSHAWRVWDENVPRDDVRPELWDPDYPDADLDNRSGIVIWATDGNRWRSEPNNSILYRPLNYDWQARIRLPEELDSDNGSSINDLPSEGSDIQEIMAFRPDMSPQRRGGPEDEDSMGFDLRRVDSAGSADVPYDDLTEEEQVERQQEYHTGRIFQMANLQERQRQRAMEEPMDPDGLLMRARNDEIDGGNYTPIPPSQRNRTYEQLLTNGWYIDPQQELRARWQEYMTIAFLRFKEQHGLNNDVSVAELTPRQREAFVEFLRLDGTPMFFEEPYIRTLLNIYAHQQMIESFMPGPGGNAGGMIANPFLVPDGIRGGAMEAENRGIDPQRAALARLQNRRAELQRQNQLAGRGAGGGFRLNMVRNPRAMRQPAELNAARRLAGAQIALNNFENDFGARSRIRRNRDRPPANRNINADLDGWNDLADDELEAEWDLPEPGPEPADLGRIAVQLDSDDDAPAPLPRPNPLGPLAGWFQALFQPPPQQPPVGLPIRFWQPPASPSTEAENAGEEVEDPQGPIPQLERFDSSGTGSVDSDIPEVDSNDRPSPATS
ncbi:hypothetical protein TWF730_011246 [Orbilia blumenaviensis]|uniref:Uncharacterized protein n=1 Tax=Orbilia blumenaviensis TaxID=1796055 RepID=A0AAV9UKQ6_9PEZI